MTLPADLPTLWFIVVGVLLTGYAVLDGFDLGTGTLYLLVDNDRDRRILLNAIGPVWDGNEVWLVTGGGALFAAFPVVYAEVFSGFYLAFMLLLLALICRAVSFEFRSKHAAPAWRRVWDLCFALGSMGTSLILGIAIGNLAWGIPLGPDHRYLGGFLALLRPYPLLVGVTTLALFAMHGALYLTMKTEDALQTRVRGWARKAYVLFLITGAATTLVTVLFLPRLTARLTTGPLWLLIPALGLLAVINIPRALRRGRASQAFLSSCACIVVLMLLFGIGTYPHMVYSNVNPAHSLTVHNAASSPATLKIMAGIAAIGMPLVIAYTVAIYRVFRGKVKLDPESY